MREKGGDAMADSMVTARMTAEKKRAGSQVLEEAGMTASQAVNRLYDYLVEFGHLPPELASGQTHAAASRQERLEAATTQVDAIPHVELDAEFATMSSDAARMRRLASRGLAEDVGA